MSSPDSFTLRALDQQATVRSRVTTALRDALVAGEMKPGQIYSAPSLAAMLAVSATPVREAMLDLSREGLVETVRNKGFRVTEPSARELDEIAALRQLIEVPAIGMVAGSAPAEKVAALRGLADDIVTAAQDGELIAFVRADTEFHLRLLALAGNQTLIEEVARLRSRSRLYGLRKLADSGSLTASAAEHCQLLDLIEAGDAEGAKDLMNTHIGHIRGVWA